MSIATIVKMTSQPKVVMTAVESMLKLNSIRFVLFKCKSQSKIRDWMLGLQWTSQECLDPYGSSYISQPDWNEQWYQTSFITNKRTQETAARQVT